MKSEQKTSFIAGAGGSWQQPAELRFGKCVFRRWTREILLDGVLQPVERRTFELIAYLIAHASRVVTKEELLDNVWHNRWVSESVISQSVMKARRAIGDDGRNPTIIRTVHRVGYRFVAAARTSMAEARQQPAGNRSQAE